MNSLLPRLLGFLVVLSTTTFAQTYARPKTILGMKWGASRGEVLKTLADAGATVPETLADSTEPRIEVLGGKFADQDVVSWSVDLIHGRLVGLAVTMKAAHSGSALYRELKQELSKKYGPHIAERKLNNLTIEQRRALQVAGITRMPNQGAAVSWKFLPNLQERDTFSITCEMTPPVGVATEDESKFVVTLRYACESLKAQLNGIDPNADLSAPVKPGRPLKGKDL